MKTNFQVACLALSIGRNGSHIANENHSAVIPGDECGKSFAESRIVGGHDVLPHGHPWMVRLVQFKKQTSGYCGGTLISRRHVLTAAHCAITCKKEYVARGVQTTCKSRGLCWAVLGDHDRTKNDGEIFKKIQDFETHPKACRGHYSHKAFVYDYAIIVLTTCVKLTRNIQPACLPDDSKSTYNNQTAIVLGWGALKYRKDSSDDAGRHPNILQYADIQIFPNDQCRAALRGFKIFSPKFLMCAGDPNQWERDSCQDDSGGKGV